MWKDLENYFTDFDGTTQACRAIALWITLALVLAFAVGKLYLFILGKKSDKYDAQTLAQSGRLFNLAWAVAALAFAAIFIVLFTVRFFVDAVGPDSSETIVPMLFYPLLCTVLAAVGSMITLLIKPTKLAKIVCASVVFCAFIASLVCIAVYYSGGEAGEAFSNAGLYVSAALLAVTIVLFAFFSDRAKKAFDTRAITFAAICVAMSFALSYVRIFKMPMGGSITFASMLPLMLFAFMFGCRKGMMAGLVFGVLQAVQDPWIIHPAQFLLDYILAFTAIGLTGCIRGLGLFKNNMRAQFALGAVIACAFRFVSHYFAGVFAFGAYGEYYAAKYNMPVLSNAYLYSFIYQCMYVIPELAIVLAVGMIVFASKNFRHQVELYSAGKKSAVDTHAEQDPAAETAVDMPIADEPADASASAADAHVDASTDDAPTEEKDKAAAEQ